VSDPKQRADPKDYFLASDETSDDELFQSSARLGVLIAPLVDGTETFVAMEEAIVAAKHSVYLTLWIFNPDTKLLSKKVRAAGVERWKDLLRLTASRGVKVRIILTDFDAVLSPILHRNNWSAYRKMILEVARLDSKNRDNLQVICSLHPARATVLIKSKLESDLKVHIASLNKLMKKKDGAASAFEKFANWPGLWQFVVFDAKKKVFVQREDISLVAVPGSHHQKTCVVDEIIAFCGGLDVNSGRIDTPAHQSKNVAWHDIHCRVEGLVALDICRNFVGRWNHEAPVFETFVKSANGLKPPSPLPVQSTLTTLAVTAAKVPVTGKSLVQIQRTLSTDSFTPVPKTLVDSIRRGYRQAIGQAQHYIYIENQYVRSPELAEWILDRADQIKDLQTIIVLPVAPEEVAAKGGADLITKHGLALQHKVFVDLQQALKDRVALFSLIQKMSGRGGATEMFGSPQIYVHSKLMIIDDRYAHISSANTNPRSFYVDTEIGAACYDPLMVLKLRLRLWREHLGHPVGMDRWVPANFIAEWTKVAKENATTQIKKRPGFAVPHDIAKFTGALMGGLPDAFASIFDPEVVRDEEEGVLA
jgi:phospholipase D1/2